MSWRLVARVVAQTAARTAALLALLAFAASCGGDRQSGAGKSGGGVRPIPVTRRITLPAEQVREPAQASNKAALTLSSAAADELVEGPTGFDVMSDGGFLVTDPLRERLVSFDSQGAFRWDLPIQYRAETVRILDNGDLETVNAIDSARYIHVRDARGNFGPPQAAPAGRPSAAETEAGQATLANGAHGTITDLQGGAPLEVFFEAPGRRMVSLRRLGKDAQNNSYVAVESGASSETIDVQTSIRKYAADGHEISEIQDIASNDVEHPVEEFREKAGILYQMTPAANGVEIRVWDTNGVR